MIITTLTPSRYGVHEECAHKYFIEYVLGYRGPGNPKTDQGTVVHKVLEILALYKKAKQDNSKTICDGELFTEPIDVDSLSLCHKHLTELSFNYYTKILKQEWLDKKTKQPEPQRHLKECQESVLIILEDPHFNPLKREIISAEKEFELPIEEPWAKFEYKNYFGQDMSGYLGLKGIIDLICKSDGDTVEVIDWKRGQRKNWTTGEVKTYDKLMKDPQLRIYHYAISKLFPEYKSLIITIYYIHDGGPFSLAFSKKDLAETEKMVKEKFELVKSTRIPRLNKSWRCTKFCHFGKTTFENPQKETRPGQLTEIGKPMTMCQEVDWNIKKNGIETTIAQKTNGDFKIKCPTYKIE